MRVKQILRLGHTDGAFPENENFGSSGEWPYFSHEALSKVGIATPLWKFVFRNS